MSDSLRLYGYWRSSAAYRVRIGLNLKGLVYDSAPVHLIRDGGEQHSAAFGRVNPQKFVPVLQHGERMIRQSLAILEYLDETWGGSAALLPATARERARVRALALIVACDIHPLNNLRILQYLESEWNAPQAERDEWVRHWIREGLGAFEGLLADDPATGAFCEGDTPTIADCALIPQVYNARRFAVDMTPYPTIRRIEAECLALPAFDSARPEKQADAPHQSD